MENTTLEKARDYFGRDRYAAMSGFVIESVEGDAATVTCDIQDCHLNAADTVMGGVLFAMADFAFAVGCNAAWLRGTGSRTVAADCHIQFLKSARHGRLTARAIPLQNGRKLGFYRVEVTDDADQLIAVMQSAGCRTE